MAHKNLQTVCYNNGYKNPRTHKHYGTSFSSLVEMISFFRLQRSVGNVIYSETSK